MDFSESAASIVGQGTCTIGASRADEDGRVRTIDPFADEVADVASDRPVTIRFAGVRHGRYDRITAFFRNDGRKPVRLDIAMQVDGGGDGSGGVFALAPGEIAAAGVVVSGEAPVDVRITVAAVDAGSEGARFTCKLCLYAANPLTDIADAFGSDKGACTAYSLTFCAHGYGEVYDRLFRPLRDRAINILEVGLHAPSTHGGEPTDAPSLRMWETYFPHAAVYGFDLNDFSNVRLARSVIFRGDQSCRADLGRIGDAVGRDFFDIIIDDGSHQSSHQQISLGALFPLLRPGGRYVIEDLSWQPDPTETPHTIDLLRGWAGNGTLASPFMTPEEARFIAVHTAALEIARPRIATRRS